MVYKLLKIYKNELNLKNIVLRHISWNKFIVHIILFFLSIVGPFILKLNFDEALTDILYLFVIPIVLNFFKKLDKEVKRVYKDVHGGLNYVKLRISRLNKFLKEEGIDHSKEKINLLIAMIDKNAEELRVPFLVGRGLLVALLVPIWVQCLAWAFQKQITQIKEAVIFVCIILAVLIVIWYLIIIFKYTVYDEFFNGDYNRYKTIANDLREIILKNL